MSNSLPNSLILYNLKNYGSSLPFKTITVEMSPLHARMHTAMLLTYKTRSVYHIIGENEFS